MVVTDLDEVNKSLACASIKDCPNSRVWDACLVNQTFGYYDFFTLRANEQLNENCFSFVNKLKLKRSVKIENN